MRLSQTTQITAPTLCRHWTLRHGFCTLRAFPPGTDAERIYWTKHGIDPPIVLRGPDCVAVGPWRVT
jgi:hypothetical protein